MRSGGIMGLSPFPSPLALAFTWLMFNKLKRRLETSKRSRYKISLSTYLYLAGWVRLLVQYVSYRAVNKNNVHEMLNSGSSLSLKNSLQYTITGN